MFLYGQRQSLHGQVSALKALSGPGLHALLLHGNLHDGLLPASCTSLTQVVSCCLAGIYTSVCGAQEGGRRTRQHALLQGPGGEEAEPVQAVCGHLPGVLLDLCGRQRPGAAPCSPPLVL